MKAFLDDHNFALYTEHLSFCSDARHHYDLYPIPFTQEAVHHVAGWMRLAQDILERPIALENASYYVKLPLAEMDELAFINAVPKRTELMSRVIIEQLLAQAETANIHTLDLTGGAPEMHPDFRYLVRTARNQGIKVIDRCNLTIPEAPGYEDLAVFLAAQQVQITASLPCYLEENVENLMCLNTLSIDW